MKPIATVGLFSPIASLVLWSTMASAQPSPEGGDTKSLANPTSSTDVTASGSATTPQSNEAIAPKDAVASAPVAAATANEGNATSADTTKKDKKKKKNKRAEAETETETETNPDNDDNGTFVGDFLAGDPWGGAKGGMEIHGLSFRLLAQTQYRQSFGISSDNADTTARVPEETLAKSGDGWGVSRLFFGVTAEPSKFVRLKLLTDFAEFKNNNSGKAVKQAYAELRPLPKHLHFAAGILKMPFSIYELDSIANYEFTQSGPTNELGNKMDISGRDIGAEVMVAPLEKERYLKFTVGAYRGHANKENASPVGNIGARAETEALKGLRIGAGVMIQPKDKTDLNPLDTSGKDLLPTPSNPDYPRSATWKKGYAAGADITFQHKGFMLRGEGLMGTRVDYDTRWRVVDGKRFAAEKWAAAWGIAAYKFAAGPIKLEPAVRVEYLDTDFDNDGGLYRLFAFALGTHFYSTTKLILEVNRQIVESNTPVIDQPKPLREVPYNALNATTFTGRLQVSL